MADQIDAKDQRYPFELPLLEYDFDALAPVIDAKTMELHHDKHHQAYVDNLNKAIVEHKDLQEKTLSELLSDLDNVPEAARGAVRNNGGGHINHSMFWKLMKSGGGKPSGAISDAINRDFGSFDDFKTKFNEAGVKQFGSGWVFVYADGDALKIQSMPNQDTPLHKGVEPIFGNDVWEHAYYLTYNNRRPDYLKAWWDVVDWDAIAGRYEQLRGK
ncbi:MAG: superoxide dismutase [Acidobacteria bacterium]|nr:superoxide dismutase [Acidobacteriota bacterium]MCA1638497.1 superoxide dismutase [Acidobacteriota bacterium]